MLGRSVDLREVRDADRTVLENLMQFYIYDFTEFEPDDPDREGRFHYHRLASYFMEGRLRRAAAYAGVFRLRLERPGLRGRRKPFGGGRR